MVEYEIGRDIISVLVGIDGPEPPDDVLLAMQELATGEVNRAAGFDADRDSVTLVSQSHPSQSQMDVLGRNTIHVQQYDIDLADKEIDQGIVNAVHNDIVGIVSDHGFNITGTATKWGEGYQI